jgi:hypothetical protein
MTGARFQAFCQSVVGAAIFLGGRQQLLLTYYGASVVNSALNGGAG